MTAMRASLGRIISLNAKRASAVRSSHFHASASRSRALLKAFIEMSMMLLAGQDLGGRRNMGKRGGGEAKYKGTYRR